MTDERPGIWSSPAEAAITVASAVVAVAFAAFVVWLIASAIALIIDAHAYTGCGSAEVCAVMMEDGR